MIYRSWCGYCSREYSDKRWLLVIDEKTIKCLDCDKESTIVDDPKDEHSFFIERCNNGK